jgi:hypothetical protein
VFDLDSFYREAFSDLAWLFEDEEPVRPVTYMRPPSITDDEPEAMSVMDIVMMWTGAQQSGLASSSVVDSTN